MLNMIVSYNRNRGIGFKNQIPWTLGADFARLKYLTVGSKNNSVIMGRKRWESLHKDIRPLNNRTNIIISSTMKSNCDNINVFKNIDEVTEYCKFKKFDENWIIGGSQIYNEYLKRGIVNNIYTTYINIECECDTFFPELINYKLVNNYIAMRGSELNYKYETYTPLNDRYPN